MKTILRACIFLCALPPLLSAQTGTDTTGTPFDTALDGIRQHFRPDKRTALFDITAQLTDGHLLLTGETDSRTAYDSVLAAAEGLDIPVLDSIMVLPHPALGDSAYGIIVVSVGNIRAVPDHAAELTTQATMGTVVKLLKRRRGHHLVQTHDGYLGWLDSDHLQRTSQTGIDAWAADPKVVVTVYFDIVRADPDAASLPVSDVVVGNMLRTTERRGEWQGVSFADGRTGYLPVSSVMDYETWRRTRALTGENISATATMFLGVPYLWGGTSPKGMDCSGYTKTVFRLNGLELNRDASQQVLMGRDIDPGEEFQNLLKGDLLFFGRPAREGNPERIVHVAIYLGDRMFIHSSGRVRFGSFDPSSPLFDVYNLERFVRARRVIPEPTVPEK